MTLDSQKCEALKNWPTAIFLSLLLPHGAFAADCPYGFDVSTPISVSGSGNALSCDGPGPDGFGGAWWEAEARYNDRVDLEVTECGMQSGTVVWDTPVYSPGSHQCSAPDSNGYVNSSKSVTGKCCFMGNTLPELDLCKLKYGPTASASGADELLHGEGVSSEGDCSDAMNKSFQAFNLQSTIGNADCENNAPAGTVAHYWIRPYFYPDRCLIPEWSHVIDGYGTCCVVPTNSPSPTPTATPTSTPTPTPTTTPTSTPSPSPTP